MERTFSWSESFPATTHTYTHVRTHSRPVRSCTRSCGSPLCCTWIYLWLLLLILEHIFPFRPLSVAVIVKVINDRYLHVLRLHLSRSARLTSSSADSAYRSGGQLKTAPRQEGGTDSGEPSWGSPPPPSAAVATPPPICLIRCPCSNREGGVKQSLISWHMEPKRCQCTKVEVEWLKVLEAPTSYKNNCCIPFAELPHSLPSAVMSLSQITSRVCIFICHFTSCHFPLWIIDVWLWGDCPADWNTHSPLTVEKPLKMTWLEWTVQSRLVPHGLGQWGRWESSRLNSNLLVVKSIAGQDQQTQHRSYKNTVMWGTLV